MLGRAVIIAAGTMLLTGAAHAQTADSVEPRDKATIKFTTDPIAKPAVTEPDPLAPAEVQGPPPAAPGAPVAAAPAAAPAGAPDAVVLEVRKRIAAPRREASGDAADRAAVAAYYEAETAVPVWTNAQGLTPRARLAMTEISKADDWGLRAAAFELPALPDGPATTEARADAEIKLSLAALKYARHARGGRLEPSSISKLLDRRPQVYEPKSLMQAVAIATEPDVYLRGLHPRHAGFRNLQKALMLARHSTAEPAAEPAPVPTADPQAAGRRVRPAPVVQRAAPSNRSENIQRIVSNMERWRWMPDDLGDFHVWNNIPDQITTVYKNGKVVFTEKIVVGKPDTATPNFSADMQFVIFQPEWGVPGGIKNNELAPMLRRASDEGGGWFGDSNRSPSSVLARHGLRVSYNGQVVNPDSVNWGSVDINRYSFVQPAGVKNVLGAVKFRFPNKHDVYMHDTPERNLFGAGLRAFSHGCMRVQNPIRFAEVLLEHDKGWSADKVRSLVPHGNEVKLTKVIPVHNVYFTAVADDEGKVRIAGDLYAMDGRIMSALEGRTVAIASRGETPLTVGSGPVASSEDGVPPQRARGDQRQGRQQRRGQSTASSQNFNPFAGLFGN